MALVLAVDPDHSHRRTLARLTREFAGHEIVVAASCDEALAALDQSVPDLVLFPLFLSADDEAALTARLRGFSADRVQTLAIPLLASERAAELRGADAAGAQPRWFYWFKPTELQETWSSAEARAFVGEVRAYLERARSIRSASSYTQPAPAAPPSPVQEPVAAPIPIVPAVEPPVATPTAIFATTVEAHTALPVTESAKPAPEWHAPPPDPVPAWRTGLAFVGRTSLSLITGSFGLLGRAFRGARSIEWPDWLRVSAYPRWLRYSTPPLALAAGVTFTVGLPARPWIPIPSTTAPTGIAQLESVPDGAEIMVDGKRLGVTPFKATLPAGSHEVEFRYRGSSRTIPLEVAAGASTELRVDWKKPPAARLVITSEPEGAAVTVDGRRRGVAPLTLDDLAAGQHVVVFELAGGTVQRTVKLKANETASVSASVYSGWVTLFAPVELQVYEDGRRLTIDERNRLMLSAGPHQLLLVNRELGYRGAQAVDVQPGENTVVSVVLPKTTVTITATPGAEVWIDGVKAGETPLVDVPIDLGTREFVLRSPTLGERRVAAPATVKPLLINVDFTKPEA